MATARIHPITSISVHGFKSFRDEVTVPIRNLTLLAGQNSAGKSSLMQPLLLLKQTLEHTFEADPLLLDGPCMSVNDASTLFWRTPGAAGQAREWMVRVQSNRQFDVSNTYALPSGKRFRLLQTRLRMKALGDVVLQQGADPQGFERSIEAEQNSDWPKGVKRNPVTRQLRGGFVMDEVIREKIEDQFGFIFRTWGAEHHGAVQAIIHLPGLRGNPERTYAAARIGSRFPGSFVPYTASVLLGWREDSDKRLAMVGKYLQRLGISWKVEPQRVDDSAVAVSIGRLPKARQGGAKDLVNIADVGFGASQVLPVVVALVAAVPDQLVHIEQPELHLHPNAQVAMAGLLVETANRGVRVVVETHSSVLLKAIQLAVAEGEIAPWKVSLNWFERDDEGATSVKTADVGADGSYGEWPIDFADVEMDVESRYIRAAFAKAT